MKPLRPADLWPRIPDDLVEEADREGRLDDIVALIDASELLLLEILLGVCYPTGTSQN